MYAIAVTHTVKLVSATIIYAVTIASQKLIIQQQLVAK